MFFGAALLNSNRAARIGRARSLDGPGFARMYATGVPPTPKTLVVGVAGGSGSGKTTVVRKIVESIGDGQVTVLEHDRYYRAFSELPFEERVALNYDHPDSLETDLLVKHLIDLRQGQPVDVPIYDFARYARQPD